MKKETPFTVALALILALFQAFPAVALDPNTLPTGGQVVAGQATITQAGNAMTINQQTNQMIANWNTFNIGQNASVTFQQPNSTSVALNRIFDQNPSQIFGRLSANGIVFLVNPGGVYFGPTAQVDVGALVASSLNITNENFLSGKYLFERSGTAGAIINEGTIQAKEGGTIAFISPQITNAGTLQATKGTVALASGDKVSLDFTGDKLVNFTIDKGTVDALIENKNIIRADGGAVLLSAKAADTLTNAVVNNSGTIEAKTIDNQSGRILLLADMESGHTIVDGTLDASAPNGGDGGFIETSAKRVMFADNAKITTLAPYGKTGMLLIDPTDYTIAPSGGDMTGATLSGILAGGNATIMSAGGGGGANGDIFVNDNITWSSHKLTLSSWRNIGINSPLYGSGTAQLALYYGQGAADGVIGGTVATSTIRAPISLPAGYNYFTMLGSNAANLKTYYVITSLGSAGSTTGTDLQGINGNLSGNYVLGADIDASSTASWDGGQGFTPIGNVTTGYSGTFDGLGHVVSGLTINRPGSKFIGLFGYASGGSTISNVGLVGASVSGFAFVGGLVGFNSGTIANSYATGAVRGDDNAGGLAGRNDGTITNSYASATVGEGYAMTGGLVGENYGTISDSYATGAVTGYGDVGGLVGNSWGTITNSYATGAVSGSADVGGLVGSFRGGAVTNSFWDTDTTGQATSAGGGTGRTTAQLMSQATYTGAGWDFTNTWFSIDGQTRPFLRAEWSPTIRNAHQLQLMQMNLAANYTLANNIDMSELTNAAGHWKTASYAADTEKGFVPLGNFATQFTGSLDGNKYTINDLYIDRPGTDVVGLFSYTGLGSTISNTGIAGGSITARDYVGAFAGYNGGTITTDYATAAVTGRNRVGGFAGYNAGTITTSYAAGTTNGDWAVGGLVGYLEFGNVTDSYAGGAVAGTTDVGGLVGHVDSSSVTNSYATGAVAGTTNVGGLVGASFLGTFTNSFWDTQTSGQATSAGGAGRTTAQMKQLATFSGAGWNIDDAGRTGKTWRIYKGNTYPLLRGFLTAATATAGIAGGTMVYNGTTNVTGASYTWSPTIDAAKIFGTATYTADGKDIGLHNVAFGGLYSNQQGYDINMTGTTVTITQAPLTITANNDTRNYTELAYQGGNGVSYAGLVNGETTAVLAGTLAYGGTSQGAANPGTYSIIPSGLSASNYSVIFRGGSLTIAANEPIEGVGTVLTSTQNAVNSTLLSRTSSMLGSHTQFIGPGNGSGTLTDLATSTLINQGN